MHEIKKIEKHEITWYQLSKLKKKSKNKKDQLIAKFLANNYIHPQTGLITSKVKWSSRENSC